MSTYVIGDIQGCYAGLRSLLEKVGFEPGRDTLYAVGDLIARGEDSLSTIRYLRSLGSSFYSVLGNHDLHFLAVSQGIKKAKRNDNLQPLLDAPELPEIVDWLRQWPLAHAIDEKHIMVHAGLYPDWSTQQLLTYSNEINQALTGLRWRQVLENMYDDGPPKWNDKLKNVRRQRFIINATTRMRYVRSSMALNLTIKCAPSEAPNSLRPWFAISNKKLQADERILFGHWAALLGKTGSSQFVALDTGYVWGNALTLWHKESDLRIAINA
ncbi:symmetrical bis(5'-nucleosyl)-tetraphosphatase [Alteromonas lipolytica]|uniref:bis(5'-nucleosyl)-tetraphosphatase (symmetrical) n=1 Tax=Alteromonas lipolytica TaxID=1856405 RepID=A0A1E8FDU4_9ALTE|nr:symmetrical bis(5'-nucleosyl)-tetraphosphatase [Alteromonas lipolytica]OFI33758.1 bis(5'-nucleosyl)-tetraphosphatase (symmetrical) [Alteromonas lipolytica]GGF68662.1 bis(5'-nucleosyl)-tetraphosphatase, symmetrical [Alteromonas lipolytica]